MAAHPRFSPRLLIPLVWRCRLGHGAWRDDPSRLPKTPRDPQARRRSSDPKPCAGLLHPPRCAAGAPGTAPGPRPPGRHPASPARADASAPAGRPPLWSRSGGFVRWPAGPRPLRAAGPAPRPRSMPRPAVRSAQVVQTRRRQRLVEGAHRGVGGTTAAGEQGLSACGWQSHPAMGERRPRRQRQRGAALRRRRANSGPRATGLPQPRLLLPTAHNCGWPHARRRPPLGEPMPPPRDGRGAGGARAAPGAGGRTHRSRGVAARGLAVPGAAVAPAAAGLQPRAGGGWGW